MAVIPGLHLGGMTWKSIDASSVRKRHRLKTGKMTDVQSVGGSMMSNWRKIRRSNMRGGQHTVIHHGFEVIFEVNTVAHARHTQMRSGGRLALEARIRRAIQEWVDNPGVEVDDVQEVANRGTSVRGTDDTGDDTPSLRDA